jgi:2-oxoglutarate/2-oxoacid ferredoxin oxidoreductase subunit beta
MNEEMKYLRLDRFPHIWCPGCGNGIVLHALVEALQALNLDRDNVVAVAGIGCSSRAGGYLDLNTVHTAHGRAIPFATGIKLANPKLTVIVISGDGDAMAIGGNHFLHAARRNIDLSVIIFNNSIYGMTSGQYSPLTPQGAFGTTATYGTVEPAFDTCKLAVAAGASYVARGTTYHARQLPKLIANAIRNKGFSLVEAVCACPTHFGKLNKKSSPVALLQEQRDHAVSAKDALLMTKEQLAGKFLIGELHSEQRREYSEAYSHLFERVYEAKQV